MIRTGTNRNRQIWLAAIVVVMSVLYFVFDPLESAWMPQCVFNKLTGLQCVGCGSQRVFHSLLHGDIIGAFAANAFLVVSMPLILFLIIVELQRTTWPTLYRRLHSLGVIITVAILLVGWMVVRNIIGI